MDGSRRENTREYLQKKQNMFLFVTRVVTRPLPANERTYPGNIGIEKIYNSMSCVVYEIPPDDWTHYFEGNVFFPRDQIRQNGDGFVASADGRLSVVGVLKDEQGHEVDFFDSPVDFCLVGCAGFKFDNATYTGHNWFVVLHSESYPPEQYMTAEAWRMGYNRKKPLLVEKKILIEELRRIKSVELTLELNRQGEQNQVPAAKPAAAATRRPTNAMAVEPPVLSEDASDKLPSAPSEKNAGQLARGVMQTGTTALDGRAAISETSAAAVATATEGEQKTIAMLHEKETGKPRDNAARPAEDPDRHSFGAFVRAIGGMALLILAIGYIVRRSRNRKI